MLNIDFKNINFSYSKTDPIFENLEVSISSGDLIFILGENGSGKSTFLRLILGGLTPKEGKILFNQREELNNSKRAAMIGYVPQSHGLDPEMMVTDALSLIGSSHKINGKALSQRINELSESLGISSLLNKRIKQLSGGQKQLINIAIGLIHDPPVILMDEPFVGLDYGTKSNLLAYLKTGKKTILCVSHDIDSAETNADQIIVFKKGKIKEFSSPQNSIKSNPYFIAELDYKNGHSYDHQLDESIKVTNLHNRYTLICKSDVKKVEQITDVINQDSNKLNATTIIKNNLKSTLVGRYNLSFSQKDKKGKKRKGKNE